MIKPIETWTKTFAKLGRRVHRIWKTDQQSSGEYRFGGFEQLEERQMLSGTGGGDLGDVGGNGFVENGSSYASPATTAISGYSATETNSLSSHWTSGISGIYSWDAKIKPQSYETQHELGSTTGTFYHVDSVSMDEDLGTYFVSFSTYDYTIEITASDDSSSTSPTGPGMPVGTSGTDTAWYKESLHVTLDGFIIETTNLDIAVDFLDNGQFDTVDSLSFKRIGNFDGEANFSFLADISYDDLLTDFDLELDEYLHEHVDFTTSLDTYYDHSNSPSTEISVSGSVRVETTKTDNKDGTLEWIETSESPTFDTTGYFKNEFDLTLTFNNASITEQTIGYSFTDLTGRNGPTDPIADDGIDGIYKNWVVNGTFHTDGENVNTSNGDGTLVASDSGWIRNGQVTATVKTDSSFTSAFTSNQQSHERITGATRISTIDTDGFETTQIVKGGNGSIDVVNRSSIVHTTDNSNGESHTNDFLRVDFEPDGTIKRTSGGLNPDNNIDSTTTKIVHYDVTSSVVAVEDLHTFETATDAENEFSLSNIDISKVGTTTLNIKSDSVKTEAQPGTSGVILPEVSEVGTITTTGSDIGTLTTDVRVINGVKGVASYVNSPASVDEPVAEANNIDDPLEINGIETYSLTTEDTSHIKLGINNAISIETEKMETGNIRLIDKSSTLEKGIEYNTERKITIDQSSEEGDDSNGGSSSIQNTVTAVVQGASVTDNPNTQDFWQSPTGTSMADGGIGIVNYVVNNLVYEFVPIPNSADGQETSDGDVNAEGGAINGDEVAASQEYSITKTGTVDSKSLSSFTTRDTTKGETSGTRHRTNTDSEVNLSEHGSAGSVDKWDKVYNGGESLSIGLFYNFNADGSFTIDKTGGTSADTAGGGNEEASSRLGYTQGDVGQIVGNTGIAPHSDATVDEEAWQGIAAGVENSGRGDIAGKVKLTSNSDHLNADATTSNRLGTQYQVKYTFNPIDIEVPTTTEPDGESYNDGTGSTGVDVPADQTTTVPGYEVSMQGSITNSVNYSHRVDYTSGSSISAYFEQDEESHTVTGPNGYPVYGSYTQRKSGLNVRTLEATGNFDSVSMNYKETITYNSDGSMVISTEGLPVYQGGGEESDPDVIVQASSGTLATERSFASNKSWEDNKDAGHGRESKATVKIDPIDGPNVIGGSQYELKLKDWAIFIDPTKFPQSQEAYDAAYPPPTEGTGYGSSSYTSSGEISDADITAEAQAFQESVKAMDDSLNGVDITGTITETSSNNGETQGKVDTTYDDSVVMNNFRDLGHDTKTNFGEDIRNKSTSVSLQVTFGAGDEFTIDSISTSTIGTHIWTNYNLISDVTSEHKELNSEGELATVSNSSVYATFESSGSVIEEDRLTIPHPLEYDADNPGRQMEFEFRRSADVDTLSIVNVEGHATNEESELNHKTYFEEINFGEAVIFRKLDWVTDAENPNGHAVYSHEEIPGQENSKINQSVLVQRPIEDNWYKPAGQSSSPTVSGEDNGYNTTQLSVAYTVLDPSTTFFVQNRGEASYTRVVDSIPPDTDEGAELPPPTPPRIGDLVWDWGFSSLAYLDKLTQNEYGIGPLHELKHYIKGTSENAANVVTWGGADYVGATNTEDYNYNSQGESTSFAWQETLFVIGREAAISAVALGASRALQGVSNGIVTRALMSNVAPRSLLTLTRGLLAYEAINVGIQAKATGESAYEVYEDPSDPNAWLRLGGNTLLLGLGATGLRAGMTARLRGFPSASKSGAGDLAASGFADKRVSALGRWLGSKRLNANQIKQYEAQLAEFGVTLKRGAKATARLKTEGARAGFDSIENAVYLRKNATFYDAFHELQHVKHRASIGRAAYEDLLTTGTYAKEVYVFNQIWKNRTLFNKQELQHAVDYMRWLSAQYRRGAIL